ncbi:DoxX [Gemmata obscuriglobus]|uniref:DoxX family membrane protein n=1 Tax=Gemmata obscuriglobus TaxID=114 RepID=A0A2Z3H9J4_9BACT|nr:DoxX family protein [Gemmata obscuriglobus]AWM39675.1 hypothetical protein C1280_23525 [Gemmata obscuriglobus]QEG27218.1 DoxX [Gemmata obscuriglobus]VTS03949.1 Uncharacterized protein OS=Planctomyces limnophilus (strain ATCC 43296 / DSM 3776 / IFAM 1008 / 290) GN=Plim_3766 PE=4 SV=1 [Gemmata obscuriglobus UQM 2246]
MNLTPTLAAVVYAGLIGTVLSLIVATATNRWSPRVFLLLALRLAIGWHFMFEGFHKIHSTYTGPTDTNRPFSSEPYFKVAPGPIGEKMRREFSDPAADIAAKVKAPKEISPAEFKNLSTEQQAAACPEAVAKAFDTDAVLKATEEGIKLEAEQDAKDADKTAEKALKDAKAAEEKALESVRVNSVRWDGPDLWGAVQRGLQARQTEANKAEIKADAEKARKKIQADAEKAKKEAKERGEKFADLAPKRILEAKAAYARWVYGVDAADVTVKFVTGGVPRNAPQRLDYLESLRASLHAAEAPQADGLGNGTGTDVKRIAELRQSLISTEADLARDANTYAADLRKTISAGKIVEIPAEPSRGQLMDKVTMWFLVGVGACVMFGLLTRLACLLACGFLVTTYLAHPPFPWYPLPPGTEGNPVFVNKNVIEALALLVLASYPTGRWLGLDAIVLRPFCKYKPERPA